MQAHQSRDVRVSLVLLSGVFLGWNESNRRDGKDICVPTTSLLFGASHAVSYVYICLQNMIRNLNLGISLLNW
jgi:hypothetical protein